MRPLPLALLLLGLSPGAARAQHFALEADRDSVRLGEVVVLHARIHVGLQMTLASPLPVVAEGLPDGARVVGIDSLRRQQDRTLMIGDVRMAFLRPGRMRIPPLRVIVKPTPDDRGFLLESEPLYVDVVPTLPAGNPALKDIRDQLPERQVDPLMVAILVAGLTALAWLLRRRLARRKVPVQDPVVIAGPLSSADAARAAISRIEQEAWPERGETARHYEAIAAAVREYLESIDPKVHAAQTTTELRHVILSAAPVILSEVPVILSEAKDRPASATVRLLSDADLVKFAGVCPDAPTAHAYAAGARGVIDAWSASGEAS